MARQRRPYLPGAIFHLAARTVDRRRVLGPRLRTRALEIVALVAPTSGARLLAVAIMANHLHLVVQQGEEPVSRLMQPLLRRLAHLVKKAKGVEGPVFWRPYACEPCMDPNHARNAIVYTHLNPVRAQLCEHPREFAWTSHLCYATDGTAPPPPALEGVVDAEAALPLFATAVGQWEGTLRRNYDRFVEWRMQLDQRAAEVHQSRPPTSVADWAATWGDHYWGRTFAPLFHPPVSPGGRSANGLIPRPRPDMTDIARAVFARTGARVPQNLVRGRGGGREYARIRRELALAMSAAGHPNAAIARYLRLSQSAISRIVRS